MLEDDFPPEIAKRLRNELERFGNACHYDSGRKLIVYDNLEAAEAAYDAIQRQEMADYIRKRLGDVLLVEDEDWDENDKERNEMRDKINAEITDWIEQHPIGFRRLWGKTHLRLSSVSNIERVAQH